MRLYEILSPINSKLKQINEAVHRVPLDDKDFEHIKEIMSAPIPAVLAQIYLQDVIVDDELDSQIKSVEEIDSNKDVRPLIADWLQRVMPDEMYRFNGDVPSTNQRKGIYSPIHGYDPHEYRGTNDPITGNAYGRR